MSGVVQRVDESVDSTPEDEYKSLLRSLRRRKGFGLAFVRCSPAGGVELIKKVRDDLPQKQIGILELQEPIDNLIEFVQAFPNQENLNILFVVGLEKSLDEYIRSGYGGEGDYYNLDEIPPILNHLNWQRENFRDKFRHICFVFLLSSFAIKYITRRAPDFFDWGTGIFTFTNTGLALSHSQIRPEVQKNERFSLPYLLGLMASSVGLIDLLTHIISQDLPWYVVLGLMASSVGLIDLLTHIISQDIPWYILATGLFGLISVRVIISLLQLRNDEIIREMNLLELIVEIIKQFPLIDFTYSGTFLSRGMILEKLGKYEEAIAAYDRALQINSDYYPAWFNQGIVLGKVGRYEESLAAHNKTVELKPKRYIAWNNQGVALGYVGRYEEAIISYDKALQINQSQL